MTAVAALHAALSPERVAQLRYLFVSVLALGVDTTVTLALTFAHAPAYIAAASGYLLGLGVHWALSVRFVFAGELANDEHARRRQAALFVLSGLVGLAATIAIYSALLAIALHALFAKACAVIVSFVLVYLLRRHIIFPLRA